MNTSVEKFKKTKGDSLSILGAELENKVDEFHLLWIGLDDLTEMEFAYKAGEILNEVSLIFRCLKPGKWNDWAPKNLRMPQHRMLLFRRIYKSREELLENGIQTVSEAEYYFNRKASEARALQRAEKRKREPQLHAEYSLKGAELQILYVLQRAADCGIEVTLMRRVSYCEAQKASDVVGGNGGQK